MAYQLTIEEKNRLGAAAGNNTQHEDPKGEFPRQQYFNSTNVNYAATGARNNQLEFKSYDGNSTLDATHIPSQYPYNQVQETISGHVIEIDDTPGNQRILIKHNTGAGVELRRDGSITVSAIENRIDVTGGDQSVVVEGDGNLVYNGNLNLKVKGDFNIECLNYNVTAKGNKKETILGSVVNYVARGIKNEIGGTLSSIVTGFVNNVFLSGHEQSVKGNHVNRVEGDYRSSSSGTHKITSSGDMAISSTNITASADNMTVQGGNGVIGGTGIVFSGKGAEFEEGVTATKFTGDLDGTAAEAVLGGTDTDAGSSHSFTVTGASTPTITKPTADTTTDYLNNAAGGINRVKIDIGKHMNNFINKSFDTGGVSDIDVNSMMARSKLRDNANRNNKQFVGHLLKTEQISREWNQPVPGGIGRIVTGERSNKAGTISVGNRINSSASIFKAKRADTNIIPEPQYNPFYQEDITTHTKLARGITIAKFLGTEDPQTLDFISDINTKKQLAKYLYVHATIIKTIMDNKDMFRDVTLSVTESFYIPGPEEVITSGSLNDLKQQGKAVVYDVIDDTGKTNLVRLFDVAEHLKDNTVYEKMTLAYDTLESDKHTGKPLLSGRLIIILPTISDKWDATFNRNIETTFNENILSQGELVECLLENRTSTGFDGILNSGGDYGINTTGNPAMELSVNTVHPQVLQYYPNAGKTFKALLNTEYSLMQQYYGDKLFISDGLPKIDTERETPSSFQPKGKTGSQHWRGKAIDISIAGLSDLQKDKLVASALKAGFKGFGFGKTILHLDVGQIRSWRYDNTHFANKSYSSYWKGLVKSNARG